MIDTNINVEMKDETSYKSQLVDRDTRMNDLVQRRQKQAELLSESQLTVVTTESKGPIHPSLISNTFV